MRTHRVFVFLSFLLLFTIPLFSQTPREPAPEPDSIASARCRYVWGEDQCLQQDSGRTAANRATVAQVPRGRGFRPPMRPARIAGYPGGYGSMYTGEGNGRHTAIGALIGFGLGAALGAKANTDRHPGAGVKAAFLVGGVGALIGAAVGAQVSASPPRHHYRRRVSSWPEEDEDASISPRKGAHLAAARQNSRGKEASATIPVPLPEEPVRTQAASEY